MRKRQLGARKRKTIGAWKALSGFALLLVVLAAGCGQPRTGGTLSVATPDFFGIGEELARQLTTNLRETAATPQRLIMATFVNLDDLEQSCRFGRALPEALANRLFRHGFGVVEIRKADELLVRNGTGELVLTRDAARLAASAQADGIVCGTYALTPGTVIVSVRLLDAASQKVLSVADIEIQRSRAINGLLLGGSGSAARTLSASER
ncbi:MAG: FlgO family outer membrane protein [Desulfobacteraceae bacterium]|nr:FlgO family outer membrane protein [Desulfobacteraceae bacterium]